MLLKLGLPPDLSPGPPKGLGLVKETWKKYLN